MFVLSAEVGCFYSARVDDLFSSPITASTRYCAVYGQPIRHSASPVMHNPALAELGLDWRYLAFEVAPDELGQAIAGAKAMGFIGLNLTVPHKLLALDMVDVLDESAETWGAVNTICFEAKGDVMASGGSRDFGRDGVDDRAAVLILETWFHQQESRSS